jgi:RHS repeat-associated protein
VQNAAFTPQGYQAGQGGSNITVPSSMQFVEMYGYTQAGLTSGKRLQVQETLHYYVNGVAQSTPRMLNLDAAYTYDTGGEGKVLSVNYPATNSWNGTQLVKTNGPTYTYSFDAMYRPTGLKDQNNNTVVSNVTYNAANQLLTFNTETRHYNNLNQMTRLTITGSQPLDVSYNFPAGTNNGKISTQTDNLSGETVTYQYDSLNRLLSASSSQSWSETYGFDGFGNLLSKTPTGGAPTLSQSVNPVNNQIVGQTYDANGNQTTGPPGGVFYDAENRIASATGVQYAYDSRNKRIWTGTLSNGNLAQQVFFYGVDGQKLGTYTFTLGQYGETNVPEMTNSAALLATFFGSKRVGTYDRLGSAKYNQQSNAAQSFYPYGEDRGTVQPNDELKFATYTRDSATGLDYADQRYYASNFGRFMSPDPYQANNGASGDPTDPSSWNRYTYTEGDPVGYNDPWGMEDCDPEHPCPPPPSPVIFPGGNPGPGKGPGKMGPPKPAPPPNCDQIAAGAIAGSAFPGTFGSLISDVYNFAQTVNAAINDMDSFVKQSDQNAQWTWEFFSGMGPQTTYFDPTSLQSYSLMESSLFSQAMATYLSSGKASGTMEFGFNALISAGVNPTQQFVGSFGYTITPTGNGFLDVTITNTTSYSSLMRFVQYFGLSVPPSWARGSSFPWNQFYGSTPMGTIKQQFDLPLIPCPPPKSH